MNPGAPLSIVKPSFWRTRREVHDASGMPIAHIEMTNWKHTKAAGEARGRQLIFTHDGWDSRYNYMSDASGQRIATFEPVGWWGTQFKLVYNGRELLWKPRLWGTGFSVRDGESELFRVRLGGYFKPGTITLERSMDEKELLPLILYAIYEMQIYTTHASAAASGTVVVTS